MQDVEQARILVFTAEAAIADIHRQIGQQENLLSILLGRNPGVPARGAGFMAHRFEPEVPAGLPSLRLLPGCSRRATAKPARARWAARSRKVHGELLLPWLMRTSGSLVPCGVASRATGSVSTRCRWRPLRLTPR